MSLVAAYSLMKSVVIGADCRITFNREGDTINQDTLLKIVPLTTHSALGFVRDVDTASLLFKYVTSELRTRNCQNPHLMLQWLPRILRRGFIFCPDAKAVSMIYAGVCTNRLNRIHRSAFMELAIKRIKGEGGYQVSGLPGYFMRIAEESDETIFIEGTGENVVAVLKSPEFTPDHISTLQFKAIGSGQDASEILASYADGIAIHDDQLPPTHIFQEALYRFQQEYDVPTVGGMYTIFTIGLDGVKFHGFETGLIAGPKYSIAMKGKRIVQTNSFTGKQVILLYPWEQQRILPNQKFDDFSKAMRRAT